MSRIVDWVKADLKQMNNPVTAVRTVWRVPMILVRAVLVAALGLLLLAGVLALFHQTDKFGGLAFYPVLFAASFGGTQIFRRKQNLPPRGRRRS